MKQVSEFSHSLVINSTSFSIPSFSSKRGHVGEKHVLIGRKRDKLGNQTFEFLQPLGKLSHQSWKVFDICRSVFD